MRTPASSRRRRHLFAILLSGACSSSSSPQPSDASPPPGDLGQPPDAKTTPPVEQLAQLCAQRQSELAAAMCPAGDAECTAGCTYFFSASLGDDTLDGRAAVPNGSSGPWQSLAKMARLELQAGDVLCLRRGDTFRGGAATPWGVQAPAQSPIVIRPYGPSNAAKPVISGAKVIPAAWSVSSLSSKIMQVSLARMLALGPTFERQGKTYTQRERIYQLFAAGQPQRLASFPNPGEGPSVAKDLDLPAGHYSLIDAVPGTRQYRDGRLPTSHPLTGAAIDWTGARLFYRQIRWIIDAVDVTAFDAGTHTLSTDRALDCATDDCVGWGYFLVDNLGALDAPGEWYYDDTAQVLYFYPPAGLDPAATLMEASVYTADAQPPSWAAANASPATAHTTGLDLGNNSGFRVYGIAFQHFSGAGLHAGSTLASDSADPPTGTTDLHVQGCTFDHTGVMGVDIERWGDIAGADGNNRITGNAFTGQTSHALYLQTTKSEFACNTVADIGLLEQYPRLGMFGDGTAPTEHGMAVLVTSADIDVLYNRVQRTASAGISFRGPATTVAYNFVRYACYTKSDCGGIHTYSWSDESSFSAPGISGSAVMNNIVLEALGSSEGDGRDYDGPMAQGLFLDFGSHDYVVKGNVVALNTSTGILLARNRNVTVDGNLLYANLRSNEWNYPYGQLDMETGYPPTNAQISNNVIAAVAPLQIPMGMRGMTVAQAGAFANNVYFDPFAYDATSADRRLTNYLVFVAPGDEGTRAGYHLREWAQLAGESTAAGASFYWQTHQVTQELSGNLIANGTFDDGIAGWSTNSWAKSSLAAEVHPVLGPSLRYDRNGAEGGGIGAMSDTFAIVKGQMYWVRFWLAPDAGVTVPLPPAVNLGNPDDYTHVPCDQVREVNLFVQPAASLSNALLEFTPYPLYGDRFWIDDVAVKQVVAQAYDSGTVIRFDEALPAGVRSFLAYNDTDGDQILHLGAAVFVDPAGVRRTGDVTVPAFSALVLIPEAWAQNPTK